MTKFLYERALLKNSTPQKKKDQLALAQGGGLTPANRPDPDDPGGLGAEESGTERTGPTQDYLVAVQRGGRWAEVGRYYDYSNDPVTGVSGSTGTSTIRRRQILSPRPSCSGPQLARSYPWHDMPGQEMPEITGGAP
jgi:hypothetical protein